MVMGLFRDFTYIDNVIQMNILCMVAENKNAFNQIYNTAYGDRTTLLTLVKCLKKELSKYDPMIENIIIKHGPNRKGDVPHSLASIEKAKVFII